MSVMKPVSVKHLKALSKTVLWLVTIISISACRFNLIPPPSGGGVKIFSENSGTKSLSQEMVESIDHYIITGNGPNDNTFSFIAYSLPVEKVDCINGSWAITVQAFDVSGQILAVGMDTVDVGGGEVSELAITLLPAESGGMLEFSVLWNAELMFSTSIEVFLNSSSGENIPLEVTYGPSDALYFQTGIPSGFYTLQIFLKDQGIPVMGAVEMVEIKDGLLSSLNFNFYTINKPGQAVVITGDVFTLAWDDENPSGSVDEYRIYYREHGSWDWLYLDSTPGGGPVEYAVSTAILTKGTWDFAISCVRSGEESELHTSMDDSALPATGWYVEWI